MAATAEAPPRKVVVFTQLSDGLLAPNPTHPERIVIKKINAMGAHDKFATVELAGEEIPPRTTIGDIKEILVDRMWLPRRYRLSLYFWGKELDDDSKTLMDCHVVTNSELGLSLVTRKHAEMAALRAAHPLERVRIASYKVVPFHVDNVSSETTVGELRLSVHTHLHTPACYIAVVDWSAANNDTLIFKRGDQLVKDAGAGGKKKDKKGGLKVRNLHNGMAGTVGNLDSLVECKVALEETRLFYGGGWPLDDAQTLGEAGIVNDDVIFLDIRRPAPFDPDPPPPPPPKAGKKGKGGGKGKGKSK